MGCARKEHSGDVEKVKKSIQKLLYARASQKTIVSPDPDPNPLLPFGKYWTRA